MENENKEQSVEQLFYEFMEQEKPAILNWEDKIDVNFNYIIEINQLDGFTTFQATFKNLSDLDYRILDECIKGEQILFIFKGQKFFFEMGVDPNKLMADYGKILFFEMSIKDKPKQLRFIQINNE